MAVRRKRIRREAERLLEEANVSEPAVAIEQIVKSMGIQVCLQKYEDDLSGFLYRGQRKTIIGVNAGHHVHRRRFTIAHELGHHLLHDDDIFEEVHVDQVLLRSDLSSQGSDEQEKEANLFAAELLMPKEFVEKDLERVTQLDVLDETFVKEMGGRYRVSTQAFLFRLSYLGFIRLPNGG